MKNKKFILRKVPLKKFVSLLNELYMSGANFIDLQGEINEKELQDNVTVSVPIEYMSEESQAEIPGPQPPPGIVIEEEQGEHQEPTEITEEEIVDLLNYA